MESGPNLSPPGIFQMRKLRLSSDDKLYQDLSLYIESCFYLKSLLKSQKKWSPFLIRQMHHRIPRLEEPRTAQGFHPLRKQTLVLEVPGVRAVHSLPPAGSIFSLTADKLKFSVF